MELAVLRKCPIAGPKSANKRFQFDVYGLSPAWVLFTISKLSHQMYITYVYEQICIHNSCGKNCKCVFNFVFQTIAGLKSDKSSLDSALYEQQQVSANLETRKEQLEGENQDLILKKEALQSKCVTYQLLL